MKVIKDTNKINLRRQKKLNQLIDEMSLIEEYAIEFGKTKKKETNLCSHKTKFYRIINDLLDECYETL